MILSRISSIVGPWDGRRDESRTKARFIVHQVVRSPPFAAVPICWLSVASSPMNWRISGMLAS